MIVQRKIFLQPFGHLYELWSLSTLNSRKANGYLKWSKRFRFMQGYIFCKKLWSGRKNDEQGNYISLGGKMKKRRGRGKNKAKGRRNPPKISP